MKRIREWRNKLIIRDRKDSGRALRRLTKFFTIGIIIVVPFIVLGSIRHEQILEFQKQLQDNDDRIIELILTEKQTENLPQMRSVEESVSSLEMDENENKNQNEKFMDPVEFEGELLSGYAVVSFSTSDGPAALYDGYFEKGLFCGQGTYTSYFSGTNKTDFEYSGEWKNSKADGLGTMKSFYKENSAMKNLSSGEWKDGILNGASCKYIDFSSDGEIICEYSGGFLDGKFDGNGVRKLYYTDGKTVQSECSGEWKNGSFVNGTVLNYSKEGILLNSNEGTWKDEFIGGNGGSPAYMDGHGKIIEYYGDGKTIKTMAEGDFQEKKMEGYGTITEFFEDGKSMNWKYEGTFENSFFSGEGIYSFYLEDRESIDWQYVGGYKEGRFHGNGVCKEYYEDGKSVKWQLDIRWEMGLPEGEGKYTKYDQKGNVMLTGTVTATLDVGDNNLNVFVTERFVEAEGTPDEFNDFIDKVLETGNGSAFWNSRNKSDSRKGE